MGWWNIVMNSRINMSDSKAFPTSRCILTHLLQTTFENILTKEEIAHDELLWQQCFQLYSLIILSFYIENIHNYVLLDVSKVVCCRFVVSEKRLNMLTLSHIQQICSRQLWKHLLKNMENLYNCRYYYWKNMKTLWQIEKLLILNNVSFCHDVFNSRLLQVRQNASIRGKG